MSERAPETADATVRVVLVGGSDEAQRLRREPAVELYRVDDPLDAIGELASPIDERSPERCVVLADPRAVPSEETGPFVRGVRRAAPGARVYALGAEAPAGFDGAVDLSGDGALEGLLRGEAPESARDGATEPPRTAPPAASSDAHKPAEAPGGLSGLLATHLRGAPMLEAWLADARRRHGGVVEFSEDRDGPGAPVERGEHAFGRLRIEGADAETTRREAEQLGLWLALERQQRQLRDAAFLDDLTGAWNRGYFRRFLLRALETARRQRRDVTLMVYDIDDFKVYNDRFGHAAGDDILRETVRLLRSVVRPTDRVCRIGGDEFAVIFDDPRGPRAESSQHPRSISEIASRFQKQICAHRFPKLGEGAHETLTISGGMATFPWDGADVDELLERADQLLLESKRQGKNCITLGPGAERVCRVAFPGSEDGG